MADENHQDGSDRDSLLDVCRYLWEEYRYRHDFIWQLVFRVTAVATTLLVAPFFVSDSLRNALGWRLLFLPVLALAVIGISLYALLREFKTFARIKLSYRKAQNLAMRDSRLSWEAHNFPPKLSLWRRVFTIRGLRAADFEERVSLFLVLLLVAIIAFFFIYVTVFQDELTSPR